MNDEFPLDALRLSNDQGRPLLVPCAELTVYWRGSMFERADRLIGMYERVMGDLGPSLKHFETGTMAGAKLLRADSLQTVPFWLKSKPRRDIYMLRLESGEKKNDPSDIALLFDADEDDDEPLGAMRVCLPASVLIERAGQFAERVAYYIGDLDFESGHAGFGVNWDERGDDALDAEAGMARIAEHFHAVDLPDLCGTLIAMRNTRPAGIKRVSWLTLLGQELAGAVGGPEGVKTKLPAACLVHQLPGGLQIQAGPRPLAGNMNQRDDMTPYKAVGQMLAAHRFRDHPSVFASAAPGAENETSAWLARFDSL